MIFALSNMMADVLTPILTNQPINYPQCPEKLIFQSLQRKSSAPLVIHCMRAQAVL